MVGIINSPGRTICRQKNIQNIKKVNTSKITVIILFLEIVLLLIFKKFIVKNEINMIITIAICEYGKKLTGSENIKKYKNPSINKKLKK